MKKLFSLMVSFMLIFATCAGLTSCFGSKTENSIEFGVKYKYEKFYGSSNSQYYVFNSDNTGYMEIYEFGNGVVETEGVTPVKSGRVDFVWREASDGAVYLFETQTRHNEDHTNMGSISIISLPIYFSEDFFVYEYSNQYGSVSVKYIKEGSDLEKIFKNKS